MDPPRSILFGLRTNVQFFASHTGYAALETRLKLFSLLYDQVVVERGVYEAHIGETGATAFVTPEPASPNQLRPLRTKKGSPMVTTIRREGDDAAPAVPIINTTVVKAYRAQFFSVMKGPIAAGADWFGIEDFSPGGMHAEIDRAADDLARRWNWDERDHPALTHPDQPRYLRNSAFENLNVDLARAVSLGVALAPDGIHAPLLAAKTRSSQEIASEPAGIAALALVLPDIRSATWDQIAAIRKDPGLQYFRDRLRELEAAADSMPLLEQAVRDALIDEVERRMPKWGSTAVDASVDVFTSMVPVVSTAATAVTVGREVASTWNEHHRWTATLVRARSHLSKSGPRKPKGPLDRRN